MKVVVNTLDDSEYVLESLIEINFTQTADAACDCFWTVFKSDDIKGEIVTIRVFDNDKLIFNGYCDTQKISEDENGAEVFFYARSTASLLVDNEAMPFTYNKPTANQLCFTFAEPLGFHSDLPEIVTNQKYEIAKGASCYGAISRFVVLTTGKQIYITPQNSIRLYEKSKDIKSLGKYKILSAKAVINRSEPLSQICFKRAAASVGYKLHTVAEIKNDFKLCERKQYVNLSSLEQWQREYAVLQKLRNSYKDYKILELTVSGYVGEELYQRFSYSSKIGDFNDYILVEKKYTADKNGSVTRLILKKEIDVKEITYVD
ncbi:MAG: hypothetical protein K2F67_05470 [Eubacterium sp.]|nr:hypothetical protein [Eubacterium sp.]